MIKPFSHLERYASELEASGEYRVLRRLHLGSSRRPPEGLLMRRAVIVDVETTGLNPEVDQIIELAMLAFDYSPDGAFVSAVESFDQLRDPDRSISPEITKLTGITNELVAGRKIDNAEADALVRSAALVIAHNAAFDRPFCERLLPSFIEKPWACSLREVAWTEEGFESARLGQLASGFGLFFDGHRALQDCEALLEVLSRPLPHSGRTALTMLLESARRARWHIRAEDSPYDLRDVLKRRGYRWQAGDHAKRGAWCTEVGEDSFDNECEFLRTEIYRRRNAAIDAQLLTAFDRYAKRSLT